MTQAQLAGVPAPDELRQILLELIEVSDAGDGDLGPVDQVARILKVAAPSVWGGDAKFWVRSAIERLSDEQVFGAIETVVEGSSRYDARITAVLRENDLELEFLDGEFLDLDEAASEYELDDVEHEANALLTGKYDHVRGQWSEALQAMRTGRPEGALSAAVNAMEGAIKTASGSKDIESGLLALLPGGERATLRKSISHLYDFGSAVPNARHGGNRASDLDRLEARGAVRAAAVWIVTVINLERAGAIQAPAPARRRPRTTAQ